MTGEQEEKKIKKKGGCFAFFGWTAFLLAGALLVVLFLIGSLFDLGVWEEFWDLFK